MTSLTTVPLDTLYHHNYNPRHTADDADTIALAHSIFVNGLLQNLSGYSDPEEIGIGVVAGGRRLAALKYIQQNPLEFDGHPKPDFDAIPVIITDDHILAQSWAGTEAATQRPLHPADEIAAYAQLARTGTTPENIARAFGCRVSHVKRRLKLASLPAATLDALRADRITLDTAATLTLCTTTEQHAHMLDEVADQPHQSGWWLKNQILNGRVEGTDRRAVFVGTELYTLEGGTVVEDLFASNVVFSDEALLQKLFEAKVVTAAERAQEEYGYACVVPTFETHVSYTHTQKMDRPKKVPVDLPEADAAELKQLLEKGEEEELTDAEYDRVEELEERKRGTYSDEDIAAGTAFAYVDREGNLKLEGPYLPRAGKDGSLTIEGGTTVAPKPALTQTGRDDLHRIEQMALQTKMLNQPELALDLLAFQLCHNIPTHRAPFSISADFQDPTPSDTQEVRIDARLSDERGSPDFKTDTATAFAAFQAEGKKHRNRVLAESLARTLNRPQQSDVNRALMTTVGASPRDVWTPTASNHFKACSMDRLDAIWRELVIQDDEGDEEMQRFAKLKKGEKTKELEALFNDASVQEALLLTRTQVAAIDAWVPDELRGQVA